MKLLLILLAVVCGTHSLSSQIIDDFADNDLTVNPEWYGDISDFSTNELGQLQLHATSAGSSAIFLPIPFTGDNLTYSLDCFLDFSPSDNNVLTLFVELDTTDLTIANGYAIQLGESGNQDPLEFIQLINGESVEDPLYTGLDVCNQDDPGFCKDN